MSKYAYGHVPDPINHMVTGAHRLLGKIGSLPKKASLRDHVIIQDQVDTSSCVGWATAQGIWVSARAANIVLSEFPSGHGIYTLARCIDRDDNRIPLYDEGSMPNQAMRGITEWGAPVLADWPFVPANINDEPKWDELKKASSLKLLGYYRIDDDDTVLDRIRQSIVSGIAVPLATQVDQAFEDYSGQGTITAPTRSLGGHYLCAVGYDTLSNGRMILEVANSWNKSWGDYGFGHCDESWILRTVDRYVMNLHQSAGLRA